MEFKGINRSTSDSLKCADLLCFELGDIVLSMNDDKISLFRLNQSCKHMFFIEDLIVKMKYKMK